MARHLSPFQIGPADDTFSTTLTFDEFSDGSTITNQYGPYGILFSGSNPSDPPYITDDGASSTNPVLSGTPTFNGDIIGRFVVPGTNTPTEVNGLSLLIGYIDDPGSTVVLVYSTSGTIVLTADQEGFDELSTDQPDIYGFRTEEISSEPAGYEIDNVSYTPGTQPAGGLSGTPTPEESFGGSNPGEPICQCQTPGTADPVNTSTGNFTHTWTDIEVPGNGPALDLSRTYNSLAATDTGMFGNGWSSPYDAHLVFNSDGSVTVVQGNGSQVQYINTGVGYAAAPRVTATLVENGDGSYTYTTADHLSYAFSGTGQLESISDLNGYETTLSYPSANQMVITDPDGRTLTLSLSGGLVRSATDPAGNTWSYQYDASGNLRSVTDPLGRVTSYAYNSGNEMTSWTDADEGVTTNAYDADGRVIEQTNPMGRSTTFDYSSVPGSTLVTDPGGNRTLYTYSDGALSSETTGYGTKSAATWSYTYDPVTGGQATITDPNEGVTTKTYDTSSNLLSETDPLGNVTSYTYDGLDDVTSETDPLGNVTTWTYDSDGNLLSKTVPIANGGTATWSYSYGYGSEAGDVVAMTDPDGNTTTYGYDSAGDQTSATDPDGNTTDRTFDIDGRLLSLTDADGGTTSYTYDADGDLTHETDPLGKATTYTHDADGNETSVKDPNGNTTTYGYDADGEQTQVTEPDGTVTKTGYDADGNVLSQTDGNGSQTVYTYTPLGQVASSTNADGETTSYSYDGDGNLESKTLPSGSATSYSYDLDDRLTGVAYSDGTTSDVSYSYDADGNRVSMSDGTGTSSYSYGPTGQLASETNGAGQMTSYSYDADGNVTGITYPNGQTVSYSYNSDGEMASLTDWLGNTVGFSYDSDGDQTGETLPGSVSETSTFNADDALTGITDSNGGGTLATFSYRRDADQNLTSATTTGQITGSDTYSYDSNSRLTADDGTGYGYDGAGNPTTYGNQPQTFDHADELQTSGTVNSTIMALAASSGGPGNGGSGNAAPGGSGGSGTGAGGSGGETTVTPTSIIPASTVSSGVSAAPALASGGQIVIESDVTAKHPSRKGVLSARVVVKRPGSVLVAFVVLQGSHRRVAPESPRLRWKLVVARSADGAFVEAWRATTVRKGRVAVQLKGVAGDRQALLNVAQLAPGTRIGAHRIALGKHRAPAVTVPTNGAGVWWAVGHFVGAKASPSVPHGQRLIGKSVSRALKTGSWVQRGSADDGKVGLTGPVRDQGWVLAAVEMLPPAAGRSGAIRARVMAGTRTQPVDTTGREQGATVGADAPAAVGSRLAWAPVPGATASDTSPSSTFTYDRSGNRTAISSGDAMVSLSYNQASQLIGVGGTVTYAYDGEGLRASKTVGATTTQFTWDAENGTPLLLQGGSTYYVYGPGGQPAEQITGSTPTYLLADQQDSTRLLTDANGNVVGTYSYDPWGNVTSHTGTSTNLQYDGQYTDGETGYQYLRVRYYDPTTGQFLTDDPMASVTRVPYDYASDAPVNAEDALGLNSQPCALTELGYYGDGTGYYGDEHADPWGVLADISEYGGALASSAGFLDDSASLDSVGDTLGYLGLGIDGVQVGSDLNAGNYGSAALDAGFAAGDAAAMALKGSDDPAAYLAGVDVQAYTQVARAAEQIDWSSQGVNEVVSATPGDWASAFGTALSEMPSELTTIFSL